MSMSIVKDMTGDDMPTGPLSSLGVDFTDPDQASDFLEKLLDDEVLSVSGNQYAVYFWYGVVATIALTSISHWIQFFVLRSRIRAAARQQGQPIQRRSNIITKGMQTATSVIRKVIYAQHTPVSRWIRVPPMGTTIVICSYLIFILCLEFVNNSVDGAQLWQARGIRAGWLAITQIPLLILLAGKNNLVSLVTGVSFERLNVLHRWSARFIFVMAVFHFAFQSKSWNDYGLMKLEWSTDSCPPTGVAAFAILLWINLSTLAPLRSLSYEFFVIQHLLSFFAFIIAVTYHLPDTAPHSRVYMFVPIGIYVLDRVVRCIRFGQINLHPSRATLMVLEGGVTKIRLSNQSIKSWNPGAYVLLSIPRYGILQSHPATIVSSPNSHAGDLVFILKKRKGFTHRIRSWSSGSTVELLPQLKQQGSPSPSVTHVALLQGPYGGSPVDFAAFDSICFIAGSSGITFTLALLHDLADRAVSGKHLPTRRIHFLWCIKNLNWMSWASDEIASACGKLSSGGIEVKVSIYVTCEEAFSDQDGPPTDLTSCHCNESFEECYCTSGERTNAWQDDFTRRNKERDCTISVTDIAKRLEVLPGALFYSGRPNVSTIISSTLDDANGESGVACCGPLGLSLAVRKTIVTTTDRKSVDKSKKPQRCFLHVESFY